MQKQVFVVDLCIRARRERELCQDKQTMAYGSNKNNTATKLMGLPSSKPPAVVPVLHSCVCTHRIVSYICQFEPKNTKESFRNSATSFTVINSLNPKIKI